MTRICLKELSGLESLWRRINTPEQCKRFKLAPHSHRAIHMIFISKVIEVTLCKPLRKFREGSLAVNDATAYTPCLRDKKPILTAFQLKISQINLKIMYSKKKEK